MASSIVLATPLQVFMETNEQTVNFHVQHPADSLI